METQWSEDFLSDRWSVEYTMRQKLMKRLQTPTISETKAIAGLPLALILFEECHPDLSIDFGLSPPLEGPQGDLWVSPSDLLIGKVALKPPLTQKHIQALTHQGILDLGGEVEQKFLNEMRIEREKAVAEREEYLLKLFEAEKVKLREIITAELKEIYEQDEDEMKLFFENKISELLWECYEQIKELEEQMQIEFDSLNMLWQERLQTEIQQTVEKMTEEFLEKMRLQEQVLVSIFTKQIKILKMKKKCAIDFERLKCKEMIIQMKHKLHCQNVANLMYLLCKERRKCKGEKEDMRAEYLERIGKLKRTINKKSNTIRKLTKLKNKKEKQLNVRERCLIEILKQFQKFIYFALKAAPTQGEFLLNIDKLIKFEINDYCIPEKEAKKTTPKAPPQETIISDYDLNADIEDFLKITSLSDEEEGNTDVLPAFYFNDKMYVREDFRDMFSAGITIDRTNSLWNPDVEELLIIFRGCIDAKRSHIDKVKSFHSSVHFPEDSSNDGSACSEHILTITPNTAAESTRHQSTDLPEQKLSQETNGQSEKSTMSPKRLSVVEEDEERELRKFSLDENIKESKVKTSPTTSARGSTKVSTDFGVRPGQRTQSRLTLARDSLIIHISTIERKSLQQIVKTSSSEENEETEFPKTKHLEEQSSSITSTESLENTEIRPTSKLLLANDSYELIKSTIALVEKDQTDEKTQEKSHRKSQLTFNPVLVETPMKSLSKTQKQTKTSLKKTPGVSPKSTPHQVAKVVGSRKTREHEKTIDEFTDERIKSLVDIMKENPSLIRLFTPCHK